jgi:hypothetical protein
MNRIGHQVEQVFLVFDVEVERTHLPPELSCELADRRRVVASHREQPGRMLDQVRAATLNALGVADLRRDVQASGGTRIERRVCAGCLRTSHGL